MTSAPASAASDHPTMLTRMLPLLILAAAVALVFLPLLANMIATGSDYPPHIGWAASGELATRTPHFLYHVTLALVHRLTPAADYTPAALVVGLGCYLALAVLAYSLLRPALTGRGAPAASLILALALLLVGPINLFTLLTGNLYLGYINPNTYHNPTTLLLKPLALGVFLFTLRGLRGESAPWWMIAASAVLGALSTLAKPSLALALLPALPLLIGLRMLRRQPITGRLLIIGVGLPVFGVLLWQYLYFTGASSQSGFEIAPFKVINSLTDSLWPRLLLSLAFPGAVYLLYPGSRRDLAVNSAWLLLAIAFTQFVLLAERDHWRDANFYWGCEVGLFILFLMTMRFFLRQPGGDDGRALLKRRLCLSLFALHLIGGLTIYIFHLGPNYIAMW